MSSLRQLLVDIGGLIAAWWRSDTIRCSPREGRLLRIDPLSVIVFDNTTALVRRREVQQSPAGVFVQYRCRRTGDDQDGVLQVRPSSGEAFWSIDGERRMLTAEEVEIYPPTGSADSYSLE